MSANTTTDGQALEEGVLEADASLARSTQQQGLLPGDVDELDLSYRYAMLGHYVKYTVATSVVLAVIVLGFAPEKQTVFPLVLAAVSGGGAWQYLRRHPEQTRKVAGFVIVQLVFVLLGIDAVLPDHKVSVHAAFVFVPILASVVSGERAAYGSLFLAFPLLLLPRAMTDVSVAELADMVALAMASGVAAFFAASADRMRLVQTRGSRESNLRLRAAVDEAVFLSEAKSMFLASVSHEIRTPMNGVIGLTTALLKTDLDDKQAHYARTVLRSATDLLVILNDVLDTSKLQRGQVTYETLPFNPAEVVRNVIDLHAETAGNKGTSLVTLLGDDVPDFVAGDAVRFRQVLHNLVSNAVKFTARGEVRVRLYRTPDGVGVSVADTGIGIPLEHQRAVFDPFWQVDASTTRRFGGSGLGLAISRTLVEQMGGHISFESAAGVGSTFWFELPFMEATRPLPDAESDQGSIQGLRVLVAEDNEVNQMVISHLLGELGAMFEIVPNGRAAVDAVSRAEWDVVLMDCYMPEMDGFVATRTIRELTGERGNVPIIAVTASVAAADKERIARFGMDDVLGKPIDPDELVRVMEQWAVRRVQRANAAASAEPLADIPRGEAG